MGFYLDFLRKIFDLVLVSWSYRVFGLGASMTNTREELNMKWCFIFLIAIIYCQIAVAGDVCQIIQNPNDVLKCVVSHHRGLQVAGSEISEAELGIEVARQSPNPSFDLEIVDSQGPGFAVAASYLHTMELGGKRDARIKLAESERDLSKMAYVNRMENIAISTVVDLYRLRHIDHELSVIAEIIATFRKIIRQYKSVGQLSPEQNMSISVFTMAMEESRLSERVLIDERERISLKIETGIGQKIVFSDHLLPQQKTEWLEINSSSSIANSQLELALRDVEVANAEFMVEDSLSWPDLAIGPRIGYESGERNNFNIGVEVSLPLPLYQKNEAGIALKRANLEKNRLKASFTKSRLKSEKVYLVNSYNRIARGINRALSEKQIEISHYNVHTMINRGIVSSAIVIELHRQLFEYHKKLHDQELDGIRAYWEILALEGRVLQEVLL